jgi:hypothetical protein
MEFAGKAARDNKKNRLAIWDPGLALPLAMTGAD